MYPLFLAVAWWLLRKEHETLSCNKCLRPNNPTLQIYIYIYIYISLYIKVVRSAVFFEVSTPSEVRCLERGSCYRVNCQKQWRGTHFKPSPPNIIIPWSVVTITWPARFGGGVPCKGTQLMTFTFGNRNVPNNTWTTCTLRQLSLLIIILLNICQ